MRRDYSKFPLFNVDRDIEELQKHEITGALIDAYLSMISFRNLDFMEKPLPFVLNAKTCDPYSWDQLVSYAKRKYWLKSPGFGVLVFDADVNCGYVRTYRFSTEEWPYHAIYLDTTWTQIADEATLYEILDTPSAKPILDAWVAHKSSVVDLPTEFVNGRHANTTVAKSIVYSRGEGCVGCGKKATAYAATTLGRADSPLLAYLPLCKDHLAVAKEQPSVLHFLASLFNLSLDWDDLVKKDHIPDELLPVVHECITSCLGGTMGGRELRENGWFLTVELASGWRWKLRLRTLTDFCYLLFKPGEKKPKYQADSAPHHFDVPFFPNHQHSSPGNKKKDTVTPSFLYGHPLLDLKRLVDAGREYGAYEDKDGKRATS